MKNRKFSFHKYIALILSLLMISAVFTACGDKEEAVEEDAYTGVLTKIRFGMSQNKVVALNKLSEMYYESDSVLWCINPDTDIMELKALVPTDNQFMYCDDSLITYGFGYDAVSEEYVLNSYMEEVVCLIDKDTAKSYYDEKILKMANKYGVAEYVTTQTGVEDIDMTLNFKTVLTLASFSITAEMVYTYDTVDGVDDYYCTHMSISFNELSNKTSVPIKDVKINEDGKEEDASEDSKDEK